MIDNPHAAERFIDERQREAMAVVARARLQREASRATWEGDERPGWVARVAGVFRRAFQREPARIPATVQIRTRRDL